MHSHSSCRLIDRRHMILLVILVVFSSSSLKHTTSAESFCGTTWGDAASSCRQACPSGTDEECTTPGHVCFADTPCSAEKAAAPKDNFFCGTTWSDTSSNCDDREPCPRATDEECSTPGHICFGDTLCSVAAGHGAKFKYQKLMVYLEKDYDDRDNRMFCGSWWATARDKCSVETHCPNGEEDCPEKGQNCHDSQECNILDVLSDTYGDDWKKQLVMGTIGSNIKGGGNKGGGGGVRLDRDDPVRNNFCGTDWGSASTSCAKWCQGSDDDCPSGQTCFADTTCYYDDDLVPTMSPVMTEKPTFAPITRNDRTNTFFCGQRWGEAIKNCSPETHCTVNEDCGEDESCFQGLPGCNLYDLLSTPDGAPTSPPQATWMDDTQDRANFRFCGESWADAHDNCSMDRHCPDFKCPGGLECFENLSYSGSPECNAYEFVRTEMPETSPPSKRPSKTPITSYPTAEPTTLSPVKRPLKLPITMPPKPPTGQPSGKPSDEPSGKPSKMPTNKPTGKPTIEPTKMPTNKPTLGPTKSPVPIVSGLCAYNFDHLEQTRHIAKECSNIDPCDMGMNCFPNIGVASNFESPSSSPTRMASYYFKAPSSSPTKMATYYFKAPPSPPTRVDTYSPTDKMPTYSPTYSHTYSPTMITKQQSIYTDQKPAIGKNPTPQNYSRKPTLSISEISLVGPTTPKPTAAKLTANPTSKAVDKFYCAKSVEELEKSCGSATKCSASAPCPPGLGCIKYNDCKQPQQQNDSQNIEEENNSSLPNYFPGLCPLELVGLRAAPGDCQQYYDCRKGLLESSYFCEFGFLFDNSQGKCISQQFVNSKCTTEDMMKMYDLCPEGLIGLHSPPSKTSCGTYYDCYNGTSRATKMCALGLKFNNDLGKCVPGKLVDSNCKGEILNDAQQITHESGKPKQENYSPDVCPGGFIGLYAQRGCKDYYECNNSLLVVVHSCGEGLKFDNEVGKCVHQYFVDEDCNSVGIKEADDQFSTIESELETDGISQTDSASEVQSGERNDSTPLGSAYDAMGEHSPELCPLGFAGFQAKGDCTEYYYKCTNDNVWLVNTCTTNFKFDKIRSRCIPGEFVKEDCVGPPLSYAELEQEHQFANDEELSTVTPTPSTFSKPEDGQMLFSSNDEPQWSYWNRDYNNAERVPWQCNFIPILVTLLSALSSLYSI